MNLHNIACKKALNEVPALMLDWYTRNYKDVNTYTIRVNKEYMLFLHRCTKEHKWEIYLCHDDIKAKPTPVVDKIILKYTYNECVEILEGMTFDED